MNSGGQGVKGHGHIRPRYICKPGEGIILEPLSSFFLATVALLFVLVISVIKKVQNSALTGKCGEKNNFNKQ